MSETSEELTPLFDLDPIEARIIGSLIEKHLTTPDLYPLTLNSLVSACNQKTSREPVMNLSAGEVTHALRILADKGWAKAEMGTRAERFHHKIVMQLKVDRAQQAILCIMFLRGPQTLNELKTRTERMLGGDEKALLDGLEKLMEREQPLITVLPRQSGQREDRYHQLVFKQDTQSKAASTGKTIEIRNLDEERFQALEAQIKELQQQVAALQEK